MVIETASESVSVRYGLESVHKYGSKCHKQTISVSDGESMCTLRF